MKTFVAILFCLLTFALGFALGHRVGLRRALHKIGDEMTQDQLVDAQNAEQLEVRGYLYSLHALDSGRAEDIADLRKRAMTHMRVYVQGIQDLHDLGCEWTPSSLILSNATAYLTEHPREK